MSNNSSQELLEEAERVAAILGRYPEWAEGQDAFEVLHTEVEWQVPVPHPNGGRTRAVLAGRYDMVIRDRIGRRWIVDHKFYKRFPHEESLRLKPQITYYLWAAYQLWPDDPPAGFLLNVLRKEAPKSKDAQLFARYYQHRTPYELRQAGETLYHIYRRMAGDKLTLAQPGLHCGWCQYRDLCLAEHDGIGYQDMIGWKYVVAEEVGDDTGSDAA